MKHIEVTDQWLYECMPIVDEAIIRGVENHTDYEYRFSDKFENKMRELIKKQEHPCLYFLSKSYNRVAVLLLCIVGLFFLLSTGVQAYRVYYFDSFKTIGESTIMYSYLVKEGTGTMEYHEPHYLPKGYQEKKRITERRLLNIIYENEQGKQMSWNQIFVQDKTDIILDAKYDQQLVKEINGCSLLINLYADGSVRAYYEYGDSVFLMSADALTIEEICAVFDSIDE